MVRCATRRDETDRRANCNYLASDPEWAARFRAAGLPLVGDDVKSQAGPMIVHRALGRLLADRGGGDRPDLPARHRWQYRLPDMLERSRLQSKKKSRTESVQSQLDERLEAREIHLGPSDYVPWQDDNKVAFIRLEGGRTP